MPRPCASCGTTTSSCLPTTARICAAAPAGCILCAPVVRQLCLGKTFRFETFGLHQLDGFQDELELVTVTWK